LIIDPAAVKQINDTLAEVMMFINTPDSRVPRRSFLTLGSVVNREMNLINGRIEALKGYLDGSIPLEDPRTQEELSGVKKVQTIRRNIDMINMKTKKLSGDIATLKRKS